MRRTEWLRLVLALCLWLPQALVCAAPDGVGAGASAPQASGAGPTVRVLAMQALQWQGRQARLRLLLRVRNPSAWSVTLRDIRFTCSFNGTSAARGRGMAALALPARGAADVPVDLTINSDAMLQVLATLPPDGVVRYVLKGDAEIGYTMLRVPFDDQGSVALSVH